MQKLSQWHVGSSHSTRCTMIIIVSVLNEVEWLVCLFHSNPHILIDQETNKGGHWLNKSMGEIMM